MTDNELGEIRLVLASMHTKLVRIDRIVTIVSWWLGPIIGLIMFGIILPIWMYRP